MDGITLHGACSGSTLGPSIGLESANGDRFYIWGTQNIGGLGAVDSEFGGGFSSGADSDLDLDVTAQNVTTGGQVGRIDFHASPGNPCTFRWVLTPAS